ncbi:MAG: ABC transporter ATP-binding protein [Muribaculaceae bacterium]|nr:ABC transporter ATP-binding protein [Muribaculaceae bacterium]
MIRMRGIHKSFDRLEVLRGVDLDVADGEILSIVGASGAGKTTLLQILGTLDRPDSGVVEYSSTNVFDLSPKALARFRNKNIGFVFQFHRLLPEFSMLENVAMPALVGGENRREAFARAMELIDYLGLKERADHRPSQLSGGECQRAAVARALINNPAVILADEPSGSLDSVNRRELYDLFFRLRDERGQTFVIVTHDETLAARSNRTIHIADGLISNDQS